MAKKKKDLQLAVLKAVRKSSREEEIRLHGKPICHRRVEKSKKVYDRKREKANGPKGDLSYFLS